MGSPAIFLCILSPEGDGQVLSEYCSSHEHTSDGELLYPTHRKMSYRYHHMLGLSEFPEEPAAFLLYPALYRLYVPYHPPCAHIGYKAPVGFLFFGGFFIVWHCGRGLSILPKQEQLCILSQFPYTFGIQALHQAVNV